MPPLGELCNFLLPFFVLGFILNQVFRSKVDFNTELCIKKYLSVSCISPRGPIFPQQSAFGQRGMQLP